MNLENALSRRRVMTAGAVGVGALVLAGCSTKKKTPAATGTNPSGTSGGGGLAKVSAIPVGSAVSATADGNPVILSQPTAGTVVGFSAICTHRGCTVAPAGKELHCPCHGSIYDAATGAVKGGPAPSPLHKFAVHVAAGEVIAGA